ncbi:MAG TPA: hypothetical protein VLF62_06255 [Candidatus Saccharimonadales bacterium]|nr:hypothetical protein [Candidatus Saccharimonadales bacterium]
MAKPEYIPPEFDPNGLQPVPFEAIGSTALLPGMILTGIGGFNDLNTVERRVVQSMVLPETGIAEHPRLDYPNIHKELLPQIGLPLGTLLRPKASRGRIVDGAVALLPFEEERVGMYAHAALTLRPHTLLSLVIMGKLGSRGAATRPFTQEVGYAVTRGRTLRRFPAPTDSLKQAALATSVMRRTGRQVGGQIDVNMRGVYHPDRDRPKGDDGAPGKRRP